MIATTAPAAPIDADQDSSVSAGVLAELPVTAGGSRSADEVVDLVCSTLQADPLSPSYAAYSSTRLYFLRALEGLLLRLSDVEGSWQQRWAVFEQQTKQRHVWWHDVGVPITAAHATSLNPALGQLVRHDIVRPSSGWLFGRNLIFVRKIVTWRDPEASLLLSQHLTKLQMSERIHRDVKWLLGSICASTGKSPRQVTGDDLLYDRSLRRRGADKCANSLWMSMRELGWLGDVAPIMPLTSRRQPPKTPEQLVDRFQLRSPHRDVLVEYLKARAASLDYTSLLNLSTQLAGNFWADIAKHHPDLETFELTHEQIEAWRSRLATRQNGHRRQGMLATQFVVRAFYLDLGTWALNDSYWAPWVTRCPIGRIDLKHNLKSRRKVIARLQQRTRDLAPLLPALVAEADKQRQRTRTNLEAARAAGVGGTVTIDGLEWTVASVTSRGLRIRNAEGYRYLSNEEERAFWTWAIVETLRHSGLRIEEMLELTHLAIQPYTSKQTGETMPLLHIPPSKTDEERMLVASPELVHVLSTVLKRIRGTTQHVPLTQRWDPHERQLGQPLPHLFVHRWSASLQVISVVTVHKHLNELADSVGLTLAGEPVHFTPHDFRRLFATEALAAGLPPHIVQVLLGHKSLATTQGYAAIYPQDVIRSHRSFITMRRRTRPSEEYREPTPEEWAEFEAHFVQRKVSLGSCGRGYGTSCHHEHACIRCGLLRPDPAQAGRLRDIIDNLADRIREAEQHNWLGEVEGLKISVAAAEAKLAQMEGQKARSRAVDLGVMIPVRSESTSARTSEDRDDRNQ